MTVNNLVLRRTWGGIHLSPLSHTFCTRKPYLEAGQRGDVSVDLAVDQGWTDWYRCSIRTARDIMPAKLRMRIHYKDFNSTPRQSTDIPLDSPFKR